jgi:hypothetical protein
MIQRPINGILVFNLIPQLHFSISHFSQIDIHPFLTSVYQPSHHLLQSVGTLYSFTFPTAVVYSCGTEVVGGTKRHIGALPATLDVHATAEVPLVTELSITNNKPGDGC